MRLLNVIGTLKPEYGGPVEALRQMNMALHELGHESEVLTLDDPEAPWIARFPGVVHSLGPSYGKYRYNTKLIPWLISNGHKYDALVACGIWQYQSLAIWRAARQKGFNYFVYVHGALDPWFKRAFPLKHLKKWLYWPWGDYRVLRDAGAVLFLSDEEKLLARESFWLYKAREAVIDNGIFSPAAALDAQRDLFFGAHPETRGRRLILFMSRLHAKKGCDLLVEAFARVAPDDPSLHLVMAGPDQDGWKKELEALAKRSGIAERITWTGMLHSDMKEGAMRAAEVFVLPSHSENFGVVVVEALARGIPVLITNKVNIWKEIQSDGAGLVAEDTEIGVTEMLERWLKIDVAMRVQMAQCARECFERRFDIKKSAANLIDVIQRSIANRHVATGHSNHAKGTGAW
ncbi:glycosyltransferase [Nevskia soli]|uniref:glycosyltransferase n=1 Tax=Nevskia soli TaxID=418856 RepID=UPI00068A9C82|nr:glycosyltransferase [Nevskia soli]